MSFKPVPGMLSLEQLASATAHGDYDTVLAVFPDMYGRLVGKRFTANYFLETVAANGMHACNYLLACDMEMEPVAGYSFTNWEAGYGDFHCVPDLSTLRRVSWLPRTAMVYCDLFADTSHTPVEISPRRLLQRQVEAARSLGFTLFGGTEIELYLFNETYDTAREKQYHNLHTIGAYVEDYHIFQGTKEEDVLGLIRRGLDASGVPVESTKGEWGPGQQEINIQYSEALTQADRNVLQKHAAKEIAYAQGKAVTFMAKWDEKLAGSSMHVHLSLRDLGGEQSRFIGDAPCGPIHASDEFRWFLGGWIKHAAALTAFYAPYVASYKRFQAGSFAPTAIAWSRDNRTAGFRVVGHGPSLRIECRIPGADANPYFIYAAAIASGLDGIKHHIEPPPIFEGDIYQANDIPRIPPTLRDAIGTLSESELAEDAFGADFVKHYLHFLKTEQRKFDEVVTDWEKARFFERV